MSSLRRKISIKIFKRCVLFPYALYNSLHIVLPQRPNTTECITESGKTYSLGSVFTDNECTAKCKCLDDGIIACRPMCVFTKKDNSCPEQKIVYTPVGLPDAQGKSCSCPSFICEPGITINKVETITMTTTITVQQQQRQHHQQHARQWRSKIDNWGAILLCHCSHEGIVLV